MFKPLIRYIIILPLVLSCKTSDNRAKQPDITSPPTAQFSFAVVETDEIPDVKVPAVIAKNIPSNAEIKVCDDKNQCQTVPAKAEKTIIATLTTGHYTISLLDCEKKDSSQGSDSCRVLQEDSYTQLANPYDGQLSAKPSFGQKLIQLVNDNQTIAIVGTSVGIATIGTAAMLVASYKNHTAVKLGDPMAQEFIIVATNDLHSKAAQFNRLGAFIDTARKTSGHVVAIDAGDWYSGSVHAATGPNPNVEANPELDYMQRHDVVATIGNHEYDATPKGLYNMFGKAQLSGYKGLVSTNIVFDNVSAQNATSSDPKSLAPGDSFAGFYSDDYKKPNLINKSLIKDYVDAKGVSLKVGYVGIMGPNASEGCLCTRKGTGIRYLGFDDKTGRANWGELNTNVGSEIKRLRENGADVIVALMHGGHPEDVRLAKAKLGIDFISAGHTHDSYTAVKVQNTIMAQAGSDGNMIGVHKLKLNFKNSANTRLDVIDSRNVPMTDLETEINILNVENAALPPADLSADYRARVAELEPVFARTQAATRKVFSDAGIDIDETLLTLHAGYTPPPIRNEMYNSHGVFVTSAIQFELNQFLTNFPEYAQGVKKTDFFFTALELIRSDFSQLAAEGVPIKFEHIYNMVEVGMKSPTSMGNKLVILEVSRRHVQNLVGMFQLYSKAVPDATPAYSENLKMREYGIPFINGAKGLTDPQMRLGDSNQILKNMDPDYIKSLPEKVLVVTTEFMATNLARSPQLIFNPKTIATFDRVTPSELLANYLRRLKSVGINELKLPSEISKMPEIRKAFLDTQMRIRLP